MINNQPPIDTPIAHPAAPETDLRGYTWFDAGSDGPYDLADVESQVMRTPLKADQFHITGRPYLSYAMLLPNRLAAIAARRVNAQKP